MAQKVWRVGLVGAGGISSMHADGIARHRERLALSAVVDPDPVAMAKTAKTYGIGREYACVDDMLTDGGVDVAVVCTPTHVRLDVIGPLVEAGVPVFCEKPLSETFAEAQAIVAAADKAGVAVAVNQNFRRFFTFHLAREILAAGEIGRPLHWIQSAAGLRRDRGWRLTRDRYVMAIMSIHWFDGYRFLFGEEPTRVTCRGVNSPAVDGKPDTGVSLILEFPSGVVVNLSESFSSFTGGGRATLDGERGGMILDYQTLTVVDGEKNQRELTNPFDINEATVHLLLDLCDAVETGRQPETAVADNLNSIRIMEAAYRSLATGKPVNVEDVQ